MEQALITHFKRGSCPVLVRQWARSQSLGAPEAAVNVNSTPPVDNSLPALLHRHFELSQAGLEYDRWHNLTTDFVSLWFPLLYTPTWTPLHCVNWFRYTTDWVSHFPELPHTCLLTDQVFEIIHALGDHPPLAWAWNLDEEQSPQQAWHLYPVHEQLPDQIVTIKRILHALALILAQDDSCCLDRTSEHGTLAGRGDQSFQDQTATPRDIIHWSWQDWPGTTRPHR